MMTFYAKDLFFFRNQMDKGGRGGKETEMNQRVYERGIISSFSFVDRGFLYINSIYFIHSLGFGIEFPSTLLLYYKLIIYLKKKKIKFINKYRIQNYNEKRKKIISPFGKTKKIIKNNYKRLASTNNNIINGCYSQFLLPLLYFILFYF